MLGAAMTTNASGRVAAAAHLEHGLVLASARQNHDGLMSGLHTKAELLQVENRVIEAIALYTAVVEYSRQHDDLEMEARARHSLGHLQCQADLPEAAEQLEAAMGLSNRLGDALFQAGGAISLGLLNFYLGHWEEVDRYTVKAAEVCQRAGIPDGLLVPALLHAAQGDILEAEQDVLRFEAVTDPADLDGVARLNLARAVVTFARGDADAAMVLAAEATDQILRTYGLFDADLRLAWPLAVEAALSAGRLDKAKTTLSLIAAAPAGHVSPYLRAQLARLGALVAVAEDEDAAIEERLRSALGMFRELEYPYWLARTQVDLARWLLAHERAEEIEPLLAEATEVFTRLGARPDMRRLAVLEQEPTG
jgi:hypothetical protein